MTRDPKLTPDGQVDLSVSERAARRSHTGGVWSLGHLTICWSALVAGGVVLSRAQREQLLQRARSAVRGFGDRAFGRRGARIV